MLEHLSKARFIKEIADFTHGSEWIYRGINPAVIVFHDSVHLYEKGIRDVYDPLKKLFPQVFGLWMLLAVIAWVMKYFHHSYNNFMIFRQTFCLYC